jgi:hypothetical protein
MAAKDSKARAQPLKLRIARVTRPSVPKNLLIRKKLLECE